MRLRRDSLSPLALLLSSLLMAATGEAQAEPAAASLHVDGSAFVLDLGDGSRPLRGPELSGATLFLAIDGKPAAEVTIASITTDPAHADLLRHEFRVPDGNGGLKSACTPNIDGETWGFPVALPLGHPGRDGPLTITCASGAVVKCARFGYKPWAKGPHGESLVDLHAACVRMVRGDYCGDSTPHTKDGTAIDMYDDLGVQTSGSQDDREFAFEAGWTAQGAACVARTRWPDLISRDALFRQCPKLAAIPTCDEAGARNAGARLFNRSRLKPFTVAPRHP